MQPHSGPTMPDAMSSTDSMRKVGRTRNLLRMERSIIRRKGPSFFVTTKRREKKRGRGEVTSLMILLASRSGRKDLMVGRCASEGRIPEGGRRESGGGLEKVSRRPRHMMSVATWSPRVSQEFLRELRKRSQSSSDGPDGDETPAWEHKKSEEQRKKKW